MTTTIATMAVETSNLTSLLNTISDALTSSQTAFPEDSASLVESTDGISLLDIKNDLLLSYLQHLVFLILLRLQNVSNPAPNQKDLNKQVISKLIELRAYLDRGCRPLESKLRYQIDKVLRAADDAERNAAQNSQTNGVPEKKKKKSKKSRPTTNDDSDISISGSEGDSESDAATNDSDEEDLHTAPRLSLLASSTAQKQNSNNNTKSSTTKDKAADSIYRPPRINPTTMPTPQSHSDPRDPSDLRRRKHTLLTEYISEETSSAPTTQPSIGSNNTISQHGRIQSTLSSRDRTTERDRTAYEEANFTRLPAVSKAEKKKERARRGRESRDMYGGEDWTGLGGLGDRVSRSVAGGSRGGVLERREKRKRETGDGPRGDGVGIGESFEKRRRVLQGREGKRRGR